MQFTKRTTIIWGVLLVLLLAFAGLLWTRRTPPPLPPVPRDVAVKKKAAPAKANKKDTTDQHAAAAARPEAPSAPDMNVKPIVAGNLGRITQLRALEEELTLEAKIAKLKKEKEEASRSPSVPTFSLPSLTPPASTSPVPTAAPRPAATGGLRVISVQGVGGKLTATVRTGSGQVVVRKGSRLGDAVVTGISRQGVTIRRGGKTSTLPFE